MTTTPPGVPRRTWHATARPGIRMWLSICGGVITVICDGTNTATPPDVPAPLSLAAAGARNPFHPASSIACCLSA
eukprot:9477568-Pyramimonas_sp.AAC.1